MQTLLTGLKAVAEGTRLRLLALTALGDVTVSELVSILGQSQPRLSRHLRLLTEGGLLERSREGAHVFFRLARKGDGMRLARKIADMLPSDDPVLAADRSRFGAIQNERGARAQAYFRDNATRWHEIRALYIDEAEVERALLALFRAHPPRDLLDIGTGTGRMLEILGPLCERAEGIDFSREMLAVARANIERTGMRHLAVRQGDMENLPYKDAAFDALVIHQVLHFAERPERVLGEAARVLSPGGRLALVDFAPHDLEMLRSIHAHRRLGFSDGEVAGWLEAAGLAQDVIQRLPGDPLTVTIWSASRPLGRS